MLNRVPAEHAGIIANSTESAKDRDSLLSGKGIFGGTLDLEERASTPGRPVPMASTAKEDTVARTPEVAAVSELNPDAQPYLPRQSPPVPAPLCEEHGAASGPPDHVSPPGMPVQQPVQEEEPLAQPSFADVAAAIAHPPPPPPTDIPQEETHPLFARTTPGNEDDLFK